MTKAPSKSCDSVLIDSPSVSDISTVPGELLCLETSWRSCFVGAKVVVWYEQVCRAPIEWRSLYLLEIFLESTVLTSYQRHRTAVAMAPRSSPLHSNKTPMIVVLTSEVTGPLWQPKNCVRIGCLLPHDCFLYFLLSSPARYLFGRTTWRFIFTI